MRKIILLLLIVLLLCGCSKKPSEGSSKPSTTTDKSVSKEAPEAKKVLPSLELEKLKEPREHLLDFASELNTQKKQEAGTKVLEYLVYHSKNYEYVDLKNLVSKELYEKIPFLSSPELFQPFFDNTKTKEAVEALLLEP